MQPCSGIGFLTTAVSLLLSTVYVTAPTEFLQRYPTILISNQCHVVLLEPIPVPIL